MVIAEPKPEFRLLSEEAVRAALTDPDPANPIAVEVARLLTGFAANFQDHVAKVGYVPSAVLRIKPRWPIEAAALKLMTDNVAAMVSESEIGMKSGNRR